MERKKIIELLKEKYEDEYAIHVLTTFVEDFQNNYGDILSTEEVIKRLKERVEHFVVIDEPIGGRLDGKFDDEKKEVLLYREVIKDEKYTSYLIFHELLHAITIKDLTDGRRMFGFSDLFSNIGEGLNEAMTEWLTKMRNQKEEVYYTSGYDAISEQMFHLSQIIGKEKLMHAYFYEPETLANLLKDNHIDFSQIDEIFRVLFRKELDIKHMGNSQKIDNLNEILLYKECEKLFDMYSESIGKIDSVEKFEFKYQLLKTYCVENHDLSKMIEPYYYSCMDSDLRFILQQAHVSKERASEALRKIDAPVQTIQDNTNFYRILSKDKKEAAIELYQLLLKSPSKYYDFACHNYYYLFDKFSETDLIPNKDSVYDVSKYLMIGKFLSEHKNYEYDEIATTKLVSNNGIWVYAFQTLDNKRYLYSLPEHPIHRVAENQFKLDYDNGADVMFDFQDTIDIESHNPKGTEPIIFEREYYEFSQLADVECCMNSDKRSEQEKAEYKKKSERIRKKIQDNADIPI